MTSFEVKCPTCKRQFYVGGHVPKWTNCQRCGVQFVVRMNKTRDWFGFKRFFKKKGSD